MMSHAMATSQPPPSAKPLTAAMTGFDMCAMASQSPGDGRGRGGGGGGGGGRRGGGGGGGESDLETLSNTLTSLEHGMLRVQIPLKTALFSFSLESTGCFGCMHSPCIILHSNTHSKIFPSSMTGKFEVASLQCLLRQRMLSHCR